MIFVACHRNLCMMVKHILSRKTKNAHKLKTCTKYQNMSNDRFQIRSGHRQNPVQTAILIGQIGSRGYKPVIISIYATYLGMFLGWDKNVRVFCAVIYNAPCRKHHIQGKSQVYITAILVLYLPLFTELSSNIFCKCSNISFDISSIFLIQYKVFNVKASNQLINHAHKLSHDSLHNNLFHH